MDLMASTLDARGLTHIFQIINLDIQFLYFQIMNFLCLPLILLPRVPVRIYLVP